MAKAINTTHLQKHISTPPKGSVVLHITPDVAKFALDETNRRNRPLNMNKVMSLSRDMADNNWSLNGETIKFGTDGLLQDGQHRLAACVKSNVPFNTHAIFGIDPETFHHIDIGKKRDGADTLAMMGVPNYATASTVIKQIIAYESGLTRTPTSGVSNDWLKHKYLEEIDHDLLQKAIAVSKRVYKTCKWPHGVIGAFYYVATEKGHGIEINNFFDAMCLGIGSRARSPIPFMLENVNRMRIDRAFELKAHHYGVILSRAFANYRAGKSSKKADVTVSLSDKMEAF